LFVERYGRPDFIDALVGMVEKTGYMGRINPGLNRKRQKLGLPPLSLEIAEEIQQLMDACSPNGSETNKVEAPPEKQRDMK
jgi:hypothetical protein